MKLLVVSPHPDDETLGAGGTLLRYKKEGHQIYWLNITDMKTSDGWNEKQVIHRQKQLKRINEFYSFDGFYNLAFPPTKLKSMEEGEIITNIRRVFDKVRPEWIMIPSRYDAHSDHLVVYDCCMACAKTFRAPYVKRITAMEIISETDYGFRKERFHPNLFIDISNEMEKKLEAMKIYDTEIEEVPFPRNLENLRAIGTVHGGCCACRYAETFEIIKQIE